jgi:hypothetical protein
MMVVGSVTAIIGSPVEIGFVLVFAGTTDRSVIGWRTGGDF